MSGVEPVASPKSIIPRVSNPGDIFGKPGVSDVESGRDQAKIMIK